MGKYEHDFGLEGKTENDAAVLERIAADTERKLEDFQLDSDSRKILNALNVAGAKREDIEEIKRNVELPIIGIVKKEYADSPVYITPTMREVDALVEAGADIIALDATGSRRPGGVLLDDFVEEIRNRYPGQPLMADCSTVEEVLHADRLGFDFLGTTLVGYTEQSAGKQIEENDFEIIRQILEKVNHPVIAEGNINTPQKARRVLEIGCYSVVVGSIITRPQVITRTFTEEIDKLAMAQE